MSFSMFFAVFESSKPFDAKAYKRYVKAGQALASSIGTQVAKRYGQEIPDDVRQAIVRAQLIAAIDDPVNVLQHLARYLAMQGDYWAAGRLGATSEAEHKRRSRQRNDRRKGANAVNMQRRSEKSEWVKQAMRAGRRIRESLGGARLSDSELAKLIVDSPEMRSLKTRRLSWQTVRAELRAMGLSRNARR